MRLLAISDLHLGHRPNREALTTMPVHADDWLILAGDTAENPDHLQYALDVLGERFARLIWVPGNHELWSRRSGHPTRGEDRYRTLVELCRRSGVLTPEDPYVAWPGRPRTIIVPMFLLFDYTFRPDEVADHEAVAWARASGVLCADEALLDPMPWPSRAAWCHARCDLTRRRLDALPDDVSTVLVNHWPLRYDLARPPRIPRFSIWCGTRETHDWHQRYRACVVVSGHLHLRTTLWRDGVRFEEVSLGYPRDWQRTRGIGSYLREILPARQSPGDTAHRRDPFE